MTRATMARSAPAVTTPTVRVGHWGRRARTTSRTATGRNAIATHDTHARWAESARWSVWGRMPTLKPATASSTRGRTDPGSRRTAHTPIAASATTDATNR